MLCSASVKAKKEQISLDIKESKELMVQVVAERLTIVMMNNLIFKEISYS